MSVRRGDRKRDINIGKSFEALGDNNHKRSWGFMPSQATSKLGNLMIMQNSLAGIHLLHLLKRLLMLLYYLVILSNIQRKNVLML